MEILKSVLVGMLLVVPILLTGYGLFVWIGANGIILVAIGVCLLFLCGTVGEVLRSRWKATS